MPHIETNDGHICHTIDVGSGAPILLLHGSAGAGAGWAAVIQHLLPENRVLAPDFRGYGQSEPWPRGASLGPEDDLASVEALFERAAEPVHLVGHSYGGAVALQAAKRHPARIASLSLIEPAAFQLLRYHEDTELWQEIVMLARRHIDFVDQNRDADAASAFVSYWTSPSVWRQLSVPAREMITRGMPRVAAEWRLMFETANDGAEIGEIRVPTLLLSGSRTTAAARRVVELLQTALPDTDRVQIEGAGHMSPHTHAAILADQLREHFVAVAERLGWAA